MIITVCGKAGSGKSTLAKELAKKFKLKHFSAGEFMRQIAKERNMTLLELTARAENDSSIDKEIDKKTIELGKTKDNFVMDSRLAWHFIPNSIKIFLDIDLKEAARRIYQDMRADEKENFSIKQTMQNIKKRQESELKRYKELYGLNYLDKKNFGIIINSTNLTIPEKLKKATQEIEKILQKQKK